MNDATDIASGSVVLSALCTADHQCQSGKCSWVAGMRGVGVYNGDSDCGAGCFINRLPQGKRAKYGAYTIFGAETSCNVCDRDKGDLR